MGSLFSWINDGHGSESGVQCIRPFIDRDESMEMCFKMMIKPNSFTLAVDSIHSIAVAMFAVRIIMNHCIEFRFPRCKKQEAKWCGDSETRMAEKNNKTKVYMFREIRCRDGKLKMQDFELKCEMYCVGIQFRCRNIKFYLSTHALMLLVFCVRNSISTNIRQQLPFRPIFNILCNMCERTCVCVCDVRSCCWVCWLRGFLRLFVQMPFSSVIRTIYLRLRVESTQGYYCTQKHRSCAHVCRV